MMMVIKIKTTGKVFRTKSPMVMSKYSVAIAKHTCVGEIWLAAWHIDMSKTIKGIPAFGMALKAIVVPRAITPLEPLTIPPKKKNSENTTSEALERVNILRNVLVTHKFLSLRWRPKTNCKYFERCQIYQSCSKFIPR